MKHYRTIVVIALQMALLLAPQIVTGAPAVEPALPEQRPRLYLPSLVQDHAPVEVAGKNKPLPPHSKAFGKSLAEWHLLYWTSTLTSKPSEQQGKVVFLPLPASTCEGTPTICTGTIKVTLEPGSPFVLPLFAYAGESYTDETLPDDEPLPPELFTGMTILVTLNGQTVLDSSVDELENYYYGPVYFEPPIAYPEPQPRGEALAEAVIWAQGIGFVYAPLPVGTHTLKLVEMNSTFGLGYNNTWIITVKP